MIIRVTISEQQCPFLHSELCPGTKKNYTWGFKKYLLHENAAGVTSLFNDECKRFVTKWCPKQL